MALLASALVVGLYAGAMFGWHRWQDYRAGAPICDRVSCVQR